MRVTYGPGAEAPGRRGAGPRGQYALHEMSMSVSGGPSPPCALTFRDGDVNRLHKFCMIPARRGTPPHPSGGP